MASLFLASGNSHKLEELNKLLEIRGVTISLPAKAIDVEESGSSFYENAYLKARGYFERYKKPMISDDSGLMVDALPDQLGIHSARYGGENLNDAERCKLLLDELSAVSPEKRTASFVSVLCFYLSPSEVFYFEGNLHGLISQEIKGDAGFGYDPLFIPKGQDKSFAEIPEWKQLNSHRAVACKSANNFFKNFFN